MKKHHLIKITVRTRETITLSRNSSGEKSNEIHNPVCPVCHTPLSAALSAAQSSVVMQEIEKLTTELPAKISGSEESSEDKVF